MTAYIFPGQGSQFRGMGREMFDIFPEQTALADSILGYSIKQLCLEDKDNLLGQTQFTQPALFVVNALMYLHESRTGGVHARYLAGHSLGEYNALYAAGVFDFESGIKLVMRRGQLMSEAKGGGMAAIIGINSDKIQAILTKQNCLDIDIANYNSPTQSVVAGPTVALREMTPYFVEAGAKVLQLNVSAPFHSRYMKPAMAAFRNYIAEFSFNEPAIPVIANVDGRPYSKLAIAENLIKQISSSVLWVQSVHFMLDQGVSRFVEIGPGKVLTSITVKIQAARPIAGNGELPAVNASTKTPEQVEEKVAQVSPSKANVPVATSHRENDRAVEINQEQAKVARAETATPFSEVKSRRVEVTKDIISAHAGITAERLGSAEFRKRYGVKQAYLAGGMYKGISSKELVVRLGKSGYMGFYGSGGVRLEEIRDSVQYIQAHLNDGEPYGVNVVNQIDNPAKEMAVFDLLLQHRVPCIEAAAYMQVTLALVKYRLMGLRQDANGKIIAGNKIIAKVSRPEIAKLFLSAAPEPLVKKLLSDRQITELQAELAKACPMADDICVESDSGGHTDMGVMMALLPTILRMRDECSGAFTRFHPVGVGAAGGIGTPEAALSAFVLGADFVVTGSINQCTVEAGTSDDVKDMLEKLNVQDTDYAPAGDMFELGSKIQVVSRGTFFPARASKLYDIWKARASIDDIDPATRCQIEEKFMKKSFDAVYEETKAYYLKTSPEQIEKAERSPKHKMALIFRWYFIHSAKLAMKGESQDRVNYQVHCGPALGAFNKWVEQTTLASWRNRHVDTVAQTLMHATADLFNVRLDSMKRSA